MLDELNEIDGAAAFQLDLVEFFRLQGDEFVLVAFDAFHDVGRLNRADAGRHLFVADALAGGFVDLVKGGFGCADYGREEFDADRDQR
jgi:hypothetical protein